MAIQEKMRINNNLLLPVLPTDITIDILSRLSVDSVLSCKRVCQTWRALIDDIAFAQAHTNRFLLDDDEKQQQQKPEALEFFLSTGDTDFGKYNFGEHTLGDITIKLHKLITHDYPFPLPFENTDYSQPYWRPVSSCNGLVCLVSKAEDDYYNSYICVYNPLTREYVNLPTLTYKQPLHRSKYRPYIITGFGYHPCTKEYKVVHIYYKSNKSSRFVGQGRVSVYTLGSGSSSSSGWRSKGETDFKLFGFWGNLLVNGALHWLNYQADRRLEIIAFDLAEEKLRIVPSPPSSAIFPPQTLVLHIAVGVLENLEGKCLCVMTLISTSSSRSLCSMWVMNQDYRSWTKKYNIALNVSDESQICYRPLAHSKGGKILLQNYNRMEIISSDLKNPSLVRLSNKKLNAPFSQYYEIIPYMKSFVSLKALGEDGARTGKKSKELKRVRGTNNDGEEQTMTAEKRNKNNQEEGEGGGE